MRDTSAKIKAILSIPAPESKIYHSALTTSCQSQGAPSITIQTQWLGNQNADTSLEGMVTREGLPKLIYNPGWTEGAKQGVPAWEKKSGEKKRGEEEEEKKSRDLQDWAEKELTWACLSDPGLFFT